MAFQLTNIIRDVGEDARRGRVYLPLDEMKRFGVTVDDLFEARQTDDFRRLMEFQIERAEHYYAQALAQLPTSDRKTQRPGLIMAAIYRDVLDVIKAEGCLVLKQRTSLTPLRKLWLAGLTWVRS